jgi:hypothetical protein
VRYAPLCMALPGDEYSGALFTALTQAFQLSLAHRLYLSKLY